jgi:hypothetical protein
MTQCQRSPNHTILPPELCEIAPGVLHCPGAPYSPGCPGGELYVRVDSGPLHEFLIRSLDLSAREFGIDYRSDGVPTILWIGHVQMSVLEEALGYYSIYIDGSRSRYMLMRQIAHEAFHRTAGAEGSHWSEEMLAEVFAAKMVSTLTDPVSQAEHAQRVAAQQQALRTLRPQVLHDWSGGGASEMYHLVTAVGEQLEERLGWKKFASLAEFGHDVPAWIASLEETDAQLAREVLAL